MRSVGTYTVNSSNDYYGHSCFVFIFLLLRVLISEIVYPKAYKHTYMYEHNECVLNEKMSLEQFDLFVVYKHSHESIRIDSLRRI